MPRNYQSKTKNLSLCTNIHFQSGDSEVFRLVSDSDHRWKHQGHVFFTLRQLFHCLGNVYDDQR